MTNVLYSFNNFEGIETLAIFIDTNTTKKCEWFGK